MRKFVDLIVVFSILLTMVISSKYIFISQTEAFNIIEQGVRK